MKFILSPVGTSLLTNGSSKEERDLLNKNSNAKNETDILPEELKILRQRIITVETDLENANVKKAGRMSAEINGIVKIYEGIINNTNDYHCLLCTDTWLGGKYRATR